jgi:hypothetical protein
MKNLTKPVCKSAAIHAGKSIKRTRQLIAQLTRSLALANEQLKASLWLRDYSQRKHNE